MKLKMIKKEFLEISTDMCHASNIIKNNNTLFVTWFGGTHEGNSDVAIYLSKKTNNLWSSPEIIAAGEESHWNPIFFNKSNGTLFLFYKVGNVIKEWRTMYTIYDNVTQKFLSGKELVTNDKGGRGPVKNKPLKISNGKILSPSSLEDGKWSAFVDISDENFSTLEKSSEISIENLNYLSEEKFLGSNIEVSEQSFYGKGVIQPALWECNNGQISMLLRSTEGYVYRSNSSDFGKTWTKAFQTNIPNNNSALDLIKIHDTLFLCHNPIGENWGQRTPLSISISKDDGVTWQKILDLENEDGEYSYPSIIYSDNKIYVTYTWNRKKIAVAELELII